MPQEKKSPAQQREPREADVAEIAATVKKARTPARLLLGAGCSAASGVPLADDLVQQAKAGFPERFQDVGAPEQYMSVMGRLTPGQFRSLLGDQVRAARTSASHRAAARLLAAGHVDRILTTNFDELAERACDELEVGVSVYDCTVSQKMWAPDTDHGRAIFHLHGVVGRSRLLVNDEASREAFVKKARKTMGWLFRGVGHQGPLIIVGYSGRDDPTLELLAQADLYEHGMYWICRGNDQPPAGIREHLCREYNAIVRTDDSDTFFEDLLRELGVAVDSAAPAAPSPEGPGDDETASRFLGRVTRALERDSPAVATLTARLRNEGDDSERVRIVREFLRALLADELS